MKQVLFFVGIPILFIAGVIMIFFAITRQKPLEGVENSTAFVDTLVTHLSKDEKLAKRELENARKALAKLKPQRPYLVIDTHANKIYMRTEDTLLINATCSTGSGGELLDSTTGRKWIFHTPHGYFKIKNKIKEPWWRKPDWAFIEEQEPIPKSEDERLDPNVMGDYAMGFGDGFYIHGTIYERLLGINVTHGCVRLGTDDLQKFWDKTSIGADLYIF